ncbi:MAG: hypothetical protein SR3Q1_09370 [Quinella sp. 3Q1]|nr:hypothetical protein [Quinella sp. 3Q1]MBQ4404914.1 hypothetical protein [Selenomonadaceae bacterium]MBQ6131565.1 hypothetical protein [Selenomonadaceae bacterium]MBQ7492967.1 hypothetical protein [Selenomonadaceae bacterium]MBR6889079.1 hypothetical protein [Selenomonadaceae bacterium]
MLKSRFEDEDEVYIPEIGDDDSDFENVHDRVPHSNAGIALGWSALEQQMFDLLLLNRFAADDQELLDETARTISRLVETFPAHEIARIMAVAMMTFQLAAAEDKSFEDEYNKYREYIKKHPEDLEEI